MTAGKRDKDKSRLVADITTQNGRTSRIDVTTQPWNYDADLAKLREIWGEQSVKEIVQWKQQQ